MTQPQNAPHSQTLYDKQLTLGMSDPTANDTNDFLPWPSPKPHLALHGARAAQPVPHGAGLVRCAVRPHVGVVPPLGLLQPVLPGPLVQLDLSGHAAG